MMRFFLFFQENFPISAAALQRGFWKIATYVSPKKIK